MAKDLRPPIELTVGANRWLTMLASNGEVIRFKASLNGLDIKLMIDAPTFAYSVGFAGEGYDPLPKEEEKSKWFRKKSDSGKGDLTAEELDMDYTKDD